MRKSTPMRELVPTVAFSVGEGKASSVAFGATFSDREGKRREQAPARRIIARMRSAALRAEGGIIKIGMPMKISKSFSAFFSKKHRLFAQKEVLYR